MHNVCIINLKYEIRKTALTKKTFEANTQLKKASKVAIEKCCHNVAFTVYPRVMPKLRTNP